MRGNRLLHISGKLKGMVILSHGRDTSQSDTAARRMIRLEWKIGEERILGSVP
jgi:hypothetical protein